MVLGSNPGGLTSYGYGRVNGAVSGLDFGTPGIYELPVSTPTTRKSRTVRSVRGVRSGRGPQLLLQCVPELGDGGVPTIPFNCDPVDPGDSADSGSFGGTPTTTSTFVPDCLLDGTCDSGGATTPVDSSDWSSDSSAPGDSSDWSSDSSSDDSGDWSGDSGSGGGGDD